ncbi:MAG: tRNA (adenine-N1)-methyltransferase [Candidatus Methanomethylophilaceae archaeon]|nr:tRNA (adenine-N1)-methyltransferase [Candidatus Methanomethylophilaceae archaeon]
MSFKEGEFVYLQDDKGKKHWFQLAPGMLKVASLGTVDGSRLMGLHDGGAVAYAGREFHIFRPGTVDLVSSLDRGAQIVTTKDAAVIIMHCDLKDGDMVLEVGAGSGALTLAMIRAVAPNGRVLTVELRPEFADRARKNLRRAGLEDYWDCHIGDARGLGLDFEADALVMDMPEPWLALEGLHASLRPGGRFCAYIPNINQMEATVNALRERGYRDVLAMETLQRQMEVHPGGVRPSFEMLGHTGYTVFARKTV